MHRARSSPLRFRTDLRPFPRARHNWGVRKNGCVRKVALLALGACCLVCAQDATDIIRRSVERDATNFERFKNYTFLERVEERRYGRNGSLSSKEIQTRSEERRVG